jgi:hypothetical protein
MAAGRYRRVASPDGPVPSPLMAALATGKLPVLSGHFFQTLELGLGDLQHGVSLIQADTFGAA